ncbi:HD domain-containing protein [Methanomassiliicoccus luminyensis]|uniref:HD domain-containing protein n=2 Tax=Methanomassiliicoccus luminyensis TaxID=1080712 RepID=UPI0011C9C00D|nr:hypothetical protein [Methanomassiliicoccus luminyensis]
MVRTPHSREAALYIHLANSESDQLLIDSEQMARQIFPFIQRNFRDLTGHGIVHSTSIISYLNLFISILKAEGLELSRTEVRLLYSAAWLHDIGYLTCSERSEHSRESCRLLQIIEENYSLLGDLKNSMMYLVKYHQSRYDLSEVPKNAVHIHGDQVRLQFLCALFRLADACHIGEDRANRLVYYLIEGEINPESKPHWIGNSSVLSVDFIVEDAKILITVTNENDAKVLTDGFIKDFQKLMPFLAPAFPFYSVEIQSETPFELEGGRI